MITMMSSKQYFVCCTTALNACVQQQTIMTQGATKKFMNCSTIIIEAQRYEQELCWARLEEQVPSHIVALHSGCFQATRDETAAYSYRGTSKD